VLPPAEGGIQHHDNSNDDGVCGPALAAFHGPRGQGHSGGDQQQVDQRVLQLRQCAAPCRPLGHGTQRIGTITREAARRLRSAQTRLQVRLPCRGVVIAVPIASADYPSRPAKAASLRCQWRWEPLRMAKAIAQSP